MGRDEVPCRRRAAGLRTGSQQSVVPISSYVKLTTYRQPRRARQSASRTEVAADRRMTIRPEEIRAKLEAGRARIASRLHALADEIEPLPLEGAAEVLAWLGDQIEGLLTGS